MELFRVTRTKQYSIDKVMFIVAKSMWEAEVTAKTWMEYSGWHISKIEFVSSCVYIDDKPEWA
jgi:hypothetical protein